MATQTGERTVAQAVRGLRELWVRTTGDPEIVVGVIDGPVDRSHPALAGARVEMVGLDGPIATGRALAHGTAMASLIFGRDGQGVAPGCRGLVVPIFRDRPGECSQLDLAGAIDRLAARGVQVINISGGEWAPSGAAGPHLAEAVRRAAGRGILIVAAAGNDGCACLHVPAALPGVLAVGAMSENGVPLPSSNWGAAYRAGGLLAPGDGLVAAMPGGGADVASGTSPAAAVVSGVVALLLSLERAAGRTPDPFRVRDILLDSADRCLDDPITCQRFLSGGLNLPGAVARVLSSSRAIRMSMANSLDAPPEFDDAAAPSNAGLGIEPSGAGCGCAACRAAAEGGGLVFALGQLGYDVVSEARRDSLGQHMRQKPDDPIGNPADPTTLLNYLKANPHEAESVTWTLNFDQTPIYAIRPAGPFAGPIYEKLREALGEQITGKVERVSVPGRLTGGQARMLNGQVVPVVQPELRGFYWWDTTGLVNAVCGTKAKAGAKPEEHDERRQGIRSFLDRVYFGLRNLGATPQDRAINYAATNAFQMERVYEEALKDEMELDSIDVERSPICRPESDCWDVKLSFFYPKQMVQTVRRVYRFTVDVSDVVPVLVGPTRSWFVR
jgi:hypothetical protein